MSSWWIEKIRSEIRGFDALRFCVAEGTELRSNLLWPRSAATARFDPHFHARSAPQRPRRKQDDRRPHHADRGAGQVPTVGALHFDGPKPDERGRDEYAAIGFIRPPSEVRRRKGQQPGKEGKTDQGGNEPEGARSLSHLSPDAEAASDFRQCHGCINGESSGFDHDVASCPAWR